MHGCERRIFWILRIGAADHILQKEQIPWASLYDGQQPVSKLELPATGIGLLRRNEVGEGSIAPHERSIRCERVREAAHERCIEREVREVREQHRGQGWGRLARTDCRRCVEERGEGHIE